MPTADINLVVSLMQLLYSLMDEWRAADASKTPVGVPKGFCGARLSSLLQYAEPHLVSVQPATTQHRSIRLTILHECSCGVTLWDPCVASTGEA